MGENLLCPGEDYLLVANTVLVDIETQAKVWTYKGHGRVGVLDGVCWFEVIDRDNLASVSSVLPQPNTVERIQKAVDSPDFFILKPGSAVKLNVTALQDPGEREKAAAALTKKLQANGFQVSPAANVELVASTEPGKKAKVAYRSMRGPSVARAYTLQEYVSRLKIVYQGETAWDALTTSVPGVFRLSAGETMEEHLKKTEHPNYEWFSKVELPKLVQKPSAGAPTLGTTQITAAGLVDAAGKLPISRRAKR